jgi:hypothetical protein
MVWRLQKSTYELTYASGGHLSPSFENTHSVDSGATSDSQ